MMTQQATPPPPGELLSAGMGGFPAPPPAGSIPSAGSDAAAVAGSLSQNIMANMMSLMMRLTKPEKHIQSADADTSIAPGRTLYVNNLNDRISVDKLRESLKSRFEQFGELVEVMALKSFWRRGQAFISFKDLEAASNALIGLQGQMLEGKPMRINYAREESNWFKKQEGTYVPPEVKGPKKPRAVREREAQLQEQFVALQQQMTAYQQQPSATFTYKTEPTPSDDMIPQQESPEEGAKRKAFVMPLTSGPSGGEPLAKKRKSEGMSIQQGGGGESSMPNKTLFLEDVPADCTDTEIAEIFSEFDGLEKIRLIVVRNVGFVDFKSIEHAAAALSAVMGRDLRPGVPLCVSFAKR